MTSLTQTSRLQLPKERRGRSLAAVQAWSAGCVWRAHLSGPAANPITDRLACSFTQSRQRRSTYSPNYWICLVQARHKHPRTSHQAPDAGTSARLSCSMRVKLPPVLRLPPPPRRPGGPRSCLSCLLRQKTAAGLHLPDLAAAACASRHSCNQ